MKILGIDYGEKRIGLAISDQSGKIARRFETIENKSIDIAIKGISEILHREEIGSIIIGIPVGFTSETEQTKRTRDFVLSLKNCVGISIETVNEVFTSKMAESNLFKAGFKGRELRELVDQEAARIMLQEYLDRK